MPLCAGQQVFEEVTISVGQPARSPGLPIARAPVHCTADEARGAEMTTGDPTTEREEIAKLVQIYIEGGRRVTPPS